jgi:phage-related protein
MIDSGTLKITVNIYGATSAAHKDLKDAFLKNIMTEDQKFYPDAGKRYLNVKRCAGTAHQWLSAQSYGMAAQVQVTFVCEDPFWYEGYVEETTTIASSPTTFPIFVTGNVEVHPIITVTPSATNASMKLENLTDDTLFTFIDANFLSGEVMVFNGVTGAVTKVTPDKIQYFAGSFLRLLPGLNYIKYTGAVGTVKIAFTNRFQNE